jgi:parallel beta-helix repeat protein
VDFQGIPKFDFIHFADDENRGFEPIRLFTPKQLTLKGVYFDSGANVFSIEAPGSGTVGAMNYPNTAKDILIEETRWDRRSLHGFRPDGKNVNYTLRRVTMSDAEESFATVQGRGGGNNKANFENLVIENSTFFSLASNYGDPSGMGDVKYFVHLNNIHVNNHPSPSGKGWTLTFLRDDLGGRTFIAPTTRVAIDYSGYRSVLDEDTGVSGILLWFPAPGCAPAGENCYSLRGEAGETTPWNDWLSVDGGAYDQNAPFVIYDTDKKAPAEILFVQEPNIDNLPAYGGVGPLGDFHLQAGSPLIDGGHPYYRVPPGGGSRVDIGAFESGSSGGGGDNPPIADAGPDQSLDELTLVNLDGSGSWDPEGAGLTYQWTQTAGPTQTLDDDTAVSPSFVATDVGTTTVLTFSLVVNDGGQSSAPNSVDILVRDLDSPGVACTDTAIRAAIAAASAAGGGTVTLGCSSTTILFNDVALGDIQDNVIIDGESKNNTLEFTTNFSGCSPGDNGIGGPAIARLFGDNNVIRGFTFKNFLESLQVSGSNNLIEDNTFLPHPCSDDAISQIEESARNNTYQFNLIQGYSDKAFMMSFGGGTIHGNVFTDNNSPLRANLDNSGGDVFIVSDNVFNTTGDRSKCSGPYFSNAADYVIEFTGNRVECLRGLRIGGSVEILLENNVIEGNARVGIRLYENAVASLSGNLIQGNGFSGSSLPSGGVAVADNAQADLGGGSVTIGGSAISSPGGNIIRGNQNDGNPVGGDVVNLRASYDVSALNNCWDGTTATEIQNDVTGNVTFQPFSLDCSGAANSGPSITPIFPLAGESCTLLGNPITILVEDTLDAVDVLSLSVLINGSVVTPSISGSGSSITLSMPLPASLLPANGQLNVEVSVADTAVPPNASFTAYSFFVQGNAPTGVSVN